MNKMDVKKMYEFRTWRRSVMLHPKFWYVYAWGGAVSAAYFFGVWYTEQLDNNVMNKYKNKSKLFGGRIIYPEENW